MDNEATRNRLASLEFEHGECLAREGALNQRYSELLEEEQSLSQILQNRHRKGDALLREISDLKAENDELARRIKGKGRMLLEEQAPADPARKRHQPQHPGMVNAVPVREAGEPLVSEQQIEQIIAQLQLELQGHTAQRRLLAQNHQKSHHEKVAIFNIHESIGLLRDGMPEQVQRHARILLRRMEMARAQPLQRPIQPMQPMQPMQPPPRPVQPVQRMQPMQPIQRMQPPSRPVQPPLRNDSLAQILLDEERAHLRWADAERRTEELDQPKQAVPPNVGSLSLEKSTRPYFADPERSQMLWANIELRIEELEEARQMDPPNQHLVKKIERNIERLRKDFEKLAPWQ